MMTLSPSFSAVSDLEILVAGDTGLDRREHRLAVLDHEHAFELLARSDPA